MLPRYTSERCGDCGQGLTWIEIAFGRIADPVCGACLLKRRQWEAEQEQIARDQATGNLNAHLGYPEE